ncbi:F0F1 ATP synthase subunit B [Aliidiomarina shirensis]|uniref:ATP synthase subunit b n=1 Tax=Aliidiomarina shirensis TaxID=1048642 RepID=A0A432WNZ3_9GAMM|nr:F0F1 ATP synthase subunit B [Aliidiomarina shirensis]RUO35504.1 F0F1 ATP synthase subunit B [Aliidiomarina shirensis]
MDINLTLVGLLIAFVVFVLFCMKYVWPPIINAIEERQQKIASGLEASDLAEKDLEKARAQANEELNAAKIEAAAIIDQAKKRATKLVEEETQRGHAEREKIIASGHTEVETERNRVREELRKQLSILAIAGAEKILEREIDAQKQSDIVEKLVAEL